MIYLAAYKDKTRFFDRLIQYRTKSIYSHCELVIDNICYSSSYMDKGVRAKNININNSYKWDLYPIPWADKVSILSHFEETKHYKYSVFDIVFNQIVNLGFDEPKAIFCSAWCMDALGVNNPNDYTPAEVVKYILTRNES